MFALSIYLYIDTSSFNSLATPSAVWPPPENRPSAQTNIHTLIKFCKSKVVAVRATRKAVSKKRNKKIEHEKYARKYSGKMFLSL